MQDVGMLMPMFGYGDNVCKICLSGRQRIRQWMRTQPYMAWVQWVGFYFFIYDWLRKMRGLLMPFNGALKIMFLLTYSKLGFPKKSIINLPRKLVQKDALLIYAWSLSNTYKNPAWTSITVPQKYVFDFKE
jgi:hypothetical protein